jgi:endonuclease YncB( thermonuclease family)
MTPGTILICATLAMHDGDSGRCDSVKIRLAGMDAGEPAPYPRCRQRPQVWACSPDGRRTAPAARARALQLASAGARCTDTGSRSWDRLVVRCTVNGRDLGSILVREGLAISETNYGDPYRSEERAARRERRGIWE